MDWWVSLEAERLARRLVVQARDDEGWEEKWRWRDVKRFEIYGRKKERHW